MEAAGGTSASLENAAFIFRVQEKLIDNATAESMQEAVTFALDLTCDYLD